MRNVRNYHGATEREIQYRNLLRRQNIIVTGHNKVAIACGQ